MHARASEARGAVTLRGEDLEVELFSASASRKDCETASS
jgi:hypothetical protein